MSQQSFYYENPYSSVQYAPNDPRQLYFNAYGASTTRQQPISYSSAGEAYTQPPSNQQMRGTIQARQPNADGIRDCMPWSLINILLGGMLLGMIGVLLSYEIQNRKNEGDVQSTKKMVKNNSHFQCVHRSRVYWYYHRCCCSLHH